MSLDVAYSAIELCQHKGFEEILSSTNDLNRKLEEVLGMTKEYDTIASLWYTFYELMRSSGMEAGDEPVEDGGGLPGTGGHVVATSKDVAVK